MESPESRIHESLSNMVDVELAYRAGMASETDVLISEATWQPVLDQAIMELAEAQGDHQ